MSAVEVRNVRELRRGVEADVVVGWGKYGHAVLRVTSTSKPVRDAMAKLHAALAQEAHSILKASQDHAEQLGRTVVGRG